MTFTFASSDALALLALILSGIATWKTVQFNKRQQSLIDSQERLNQLMIDRGLAESANEQKADLGATFVKLGSSKVRLKIWNKGQATAHNVQIEFPEGDDIISSTEVEEKFPLETLEQYQSVDLIAHTFMGAKRKHAIVLRWADDNSPKNEKTVYPTW